ncbi:MAG: hypothetical protein GX885_11510 [Methanomicrobiales archaeon]|nr:hypothetical protein [Methanomicrobiales archaeon]
MDKDKLSTQPKPTWYNNYFFRSKLEAKWAVLFDYMKVAWTYEPDQYICDDGSQYTPDFYLPESYIRDDKGLFIEVKPEGMVNPEYIERISSALKDLGLVIVYGKAPIPYSSPIVSNACEIARNFRFQFYDLRNRHGR